MAFKALFLLASKEAKAAVAKPAPLAASPKNQRPTSEKPETIGSPSKSTTVAAVDDEKPKPRPKPATEADLLDPSTRITAHLAAPLATTQVSSAERVEAGRARVSLEELVPQVLRRIAWGGDRTKGSVHLELVSGERVTVHAEGRRVRLEVEGNADLERRIGSRLRAAGIEVEGVR